MRNKFVLLSFSLGLPFLAGGIGSLFTYQAIPTWYRTLNKPWFSPPNWLFGPVWTLLYILLGISLFIVLAETKKSKERTGGIMFYFIQIILNALWSILFFGLKIPLIAFVEIIILWVTIAVTIGLFYRVNKTAGLILLPYLLWVSFASVLNLFIVLLN